MKKKIKTFFKIVFAVFIICVVILVADFFITGGEGETIVTEIHEGCYIECMDDYKQSIYYYPDGDETGERKYIAEEWEPIVKYATDGKEFVAVHYIYNWDDVNEKINL